MSGIGNSPLSNPTASPVAKPVQAPVAQPAAAPTPAPDAAAPGLAADGTQLQATGSTGLKLGEAPKSLGQQRVEELKAAMAAEVAKIGPDTTVQELKAIQEKLDDHKRELQMYENAMAVPKRLFGEAADPEPVEMSPEAQALCAELAAQLAARTGNP